MGIRFWVWLFGLRAALELIERLELIQIVRAQLERNRRGSGAHGSFREFRVHQTSQDILLSLLRLI